MPQLCSVVQWSVHWAPSQMTQVLVLAGARCCAPETFGKKMEAPLLGLAKFIYYEKIMIIMSNTLHMCFIKYIVNL